MESQRSDISEDEKAGAVCQMGGFSALPRRPIAAFTLEQRAKHVPGASA